MKAPRHTCYRTGTHDCAACDVDQGRFEWLCEHPDEVLEVWGFPTIEAWALSAGYRRAESWPIHWVKDGRPVDLGIELLEAIEQGWRAGIFEADADL